MLHARKGRVLQKSFAPLPRGDSTEYTAQVGTDGGASTQFDRSLSPLIKGGREAAASPPGKGRLPKRFFALTYLVWGFLSLALTPLRARADEREAWSDTALPVTQGLALWLDAHAQGRAHAAAGLMPPRDGEPIGACFDSSGHRRHFTQRHASAQPRFIERGGQSALRFDGLDDALECTGFHLNNKAFTIFVVAAPHSNAGAFRGVFSLNEIGRRDYETGLTIDLGPLPTARFETLSIEGAGFGGAVNLQRRPHPFGSVHTIEATIGSSRIAVFTDGEPQGTRDRREFDVAGVEATLGARFYSNEPRPGYLQGFFDGDIADVLVYDRVLDRDERERVRGYLQSKHARLEEALDAVKVQAPPPAVQMLIPGFEAYRLPVELTNINNVRYRDDGVLVALGYNGMIHLLRDTAGDGIEDRADTFWDGRQTLRAPIGMALTRPGDPRGRGVYVASKGKCSLIVDRDGDDRADEEIVLAQGWTELPHGVDALGVAVDREGAVYFGLGATNFTNAYLLDPEGRARYELSDIHGTIQRIAPGGKTRTAIATGIRFPVALGFNSAGDLFCTDQEGATWLPNGNPFDELLWIRDGRHYGFPPRHAQHLPTVVDEPSVFDYTPQHQSTCGFVFNEPVNGGPVFGPKWWRGNALVCAYSRGKLFRTELVKVRGEYFARNHTIGVFDSLPVDCCVAPDGALLVAAHSGLPDWGSGPEGIGALYKIRYEHQEIAQPVAAWPASSSEVVIGFDRVLHAAGAIEGVRFEAAPSRRAGDRFESLRPGYAVVAAQQAEPVRLWISQAEVGASRDTLRLDTNSGSDALGYALSIPWAARKSLIAEAPRITQVPDIDIGFTMEGVALRWASSDGKLSRTSWLPHVEPEVARAFVSASLALVENLDLLEQPGTATLSAQLRLGHWLRPEVQPGARVDDGLPPERATIVIEAARPFSIEAHDLTLRSQASADGGQRVEWPLGTNDSIAPFSIRLETGPGTYLTMRFRTTDDDRLRPLALRRFLLPWARVPQESGAGARALPPQLAGGRWDRGKAVFEGQKARCGQCHAIRGAGGKIGPDLSNLVERDYESVLRDITRPSAALNPDHLTYSVALVDGRVLTGTLRTEGSRLCIGDANGVETRVERAEVDEMKAMSVSTMPEKLLDTLTETEVRDLLTYLLSGPNAAASPTNDPDRRP